MDPSGTTLGIQCPHPIQALKEEKGNLVPILRVPEASTEQLSWLWERATRLQRGGGTIRLR